MDFSSLTVRVKGPRSFSFFKSWKIEQWTENLWIVPVLVELLQSSVQHNQIRPHFVPHIFYVDWVFTHHQRREWLRGRKHFHFQNPVLISNFKEAEPQEQEIQRSESLFKAVDCMRRDASIAGLAEYLPHYARHCCRGWYFLIYWWREDGILIILSGTGHQPEKASYNYI